MVYHGKLFKKILPYKDLKPQENMATQGPHQVCHKINKVKFSNII